MHKVMLSVLLTIEMFMVGNVYSDNVTNEISNELLRMHILANSDTEYDQEIKIEVRDYIIDYINNEKLDSKNEVIKSVGNMKKNIDAFLRDKKSGYSCDILICNSVFDSRMYSDLALPAGEYEALKVILGEGKGKNWWCVAYPPLCFTESVTGKMSADGDNQLKNLLNNEAYNLIKNDNIEYKIKFKSIEFINSIFKPKNH